LTHPDIASAMLANSPSSSRSWYLLSFAMAAWSAGFCWADLHALRQVGRVREEHAKTVVDESIAKR
jgi:hypothetical protein